jgi:hypothetical protein
MQAEAAAAAGERAVRAFMVAVQRATSNVALVQQVSYFFILFLQFYLFISAPHKRIIFELLVIESFRLVIQQG